MQLFSGSSRKVLVVEDDPAVLELVVTRLAIAGYATFQARNGQEAIRRIAEVAPATMVLDRAAGLTPRSGAGGRSAVRTPARISRGGTGRGRPRAWGRVRVR